MLQYYYTAKYLKGRQIVGQVRNRIRTKLEGPVFLHRKAPDIPECCWSGNVQPPPAGGSGARQPSIMEGKFAFLNRTESLEWPPQWNRADLPKLWMYNLHYFDWIWNLEYEQGRFAAGDWIVQHTPGRGRTGWEPYPTSLRLMNWTGYFFGKNRSAIDTDREFAARLWQSLYLQACRLQRRLEKHLLANHLFENAAALAFVGSCFGGAAARNWYETGVAILRREIPEQILSDGVHFERSPMYHGRILYVLQLLAAAGDPQIGELVNAPVMKMAQALQRLTHPDGRIALLNDSAFEIYHEPAEICGPAGDTFGAFALSEAGYYGWRGPEGNFLICDAGPIGPDYQPGHAHSDIFSFELSLLGRRVIVDSGVCSYEPGEDRDYCRSTRAHNTVEIAGQDQCELWGSFRVARRAQINLLEWTPSGRGFALHAVHDGYKRLRPQLRHSRRFEWNAQGRLRIVDSVEGAEGESLVSRLHLHPRCRIERIEGAEATVSLDSIAVRIAFTGAGELEAETSFYCPEFGRKMQNHQLTFRPQKGATLWSCEIQLL